MINNAEAVVEVSVVYKKSCSRVCLFSPVGRGYGLNVLERSACYTNRTTICTTMTFIALYLSSLLFREGGGALIRERRLYFPNR